MMNAYIFPGQGAQFPGMGKELYDKSATARELFEEADRLLGFGISALMFEGSEDDLKQTKVTQPAVFLHSVILAKTLGKSFKPNMVAGHSLGEFSALAAAGALSFADGLSLVSKRAKAMQKACEMAESTMAAVIGLDDKTVEEVCATIPGVIPANYNSPGQLVISGSVEAVDVACEQLKARGAKRALRLAVSGAFHSPFMEPAKKELEEAINNTVISQPVCPVYQNVTALPSTDPKTIKSNLIAQLTSPVRWVESVNNMIADGASTFLETGPGNVLQGLVSKINKEVTTVKVVID